MKRKTLIPNSSTHDMVTYDLVINGNAVNPAYQVMSISVIKEVNKIPTARIMLRDGEAAEGQFAISDAADFIPGNEIQIKIGRDRTNATVFKGIIIKQHIKIRENGQADLIVDCKDKSVRMTVGRHNHYYEDSKDSEVIEQIIGRHSGLTPDVEATTLLHKELVQHHCTDWDFILSRAEVNGRLVVVDDGNVLVKKPDTKADPALNVSYGSTLLEFEAEMDARLQWKSVEGKAWDYTNQSLFEHVSDSAPVSESGNISGAQLANTINLSKLELRHSGQLPAAELQQWTDAAMLKSRLAKICGRAKFLGFSDIKPGQMIDLQGVGSRFNGKTFVSAVRHDIGNGAWDTHVQFGLPPQWFSRSEEITDLPAAGLLPGINGLQIGKVVQLQDDPDGEDRILVRLPIIDNSARGVWARMATMDAGDDRGSFFRPEIDDEVIVGFINDDLRDPVVLGMLHSSAKPAPITAQDTNHEKLIKTRSKMRIHFHDETKTTTVLNLAAALRDRGKQVLLIDFDPQCNLSQSLGVNDEPEPNIYHLLKQEAFGQASTPESAIVNREGLDLIPSSLELAGAELELVSIYGREQVLQQLLERLKKPYDFVLIDCPPSIGMLTVNALVASDHILLPLVPEFLSLKGARSFLRHLGSFQRLNARVNILGFVLTKYDARKTMNRQVENQLQEEYGHDQVFATHIRTNIALAKAQQAGLDIFRFDKRSKGAEDYRALAGEFLSKINSL